MGCSPSKGKLLSNPQHFGIQKALVTEESQDCVDCGATVEEDSSLKHQNNEEEPLLLADSTDDAEKAIDFKATRESEIAEEIIGDPMQTHMSSEFETQRKKSRKRSTERQRKSLVVQTKVNFPPHMRAHQAAYNFLNPNNSKYETLLGLLDQATETQLSLRPITSALGLFFEEINQALEEMAEEGELMLKEHGDSMTVPSGILGQAVSSAKPSNTTGNNFDQLQDLLQELIQHSSEKMWQVQSSVKIVSDTTLNETIELFSSLSKMFAEKLKAKQAAEFRLAQILSRVGTMAIRKCNLEDSALHSEDSGIGGENESLTGSERHQHHRGSTESGSCEPGVNIQGMFQNYSNNITGFVSDIKNNESNQFERKRSSSSPPDPSQARSFIHANAMKDQQHTFQQLFTTTNAEHSSSNSCTYIMTELHNSQKELDKKMKAFSKMQGTNYFVRPQYNLFQAGFRRHSLNGSEAGAQESKVKPNQPRGLLSFPPNTKSKHHSVRRLINTFSQGVDGRSDQGHSYSTPHIMKHDKSCIVQVSNRTGEDIIINNKRSSILGGREDLDMDDLPPPPLEVLLDNSFQRNEGQTQHKKLHEDPVLNLPLIRQNKGISQRRKIVMQNVEILPNKANVKSRSTTVSPTPPFRQEGVTEAQNEKQQLETEIFEQSEKAKSLYKQARKIIHLKNAGEPTDKKNSVQISGSITSLRASNSQRYEGHEILLPEMPCYNLPIIAPPVSRVRLPPSCPSVRQRFPSPPPFRPPSNDGSFSRLNSPRKVTPVNDNNTEQIIPYVSFYDARSVFCQNELQSSQACLSLGRFAGPRKSLEMSRGRSSSRGIDHQARRSQSDQRHGITSYSELETDSNLVSQQNERQ